MNPYTDLLDRMCLIVDRTHDQITAHVRANDSSGALRTLRADIESTVIDGLPDMTAESAERAIPLVGAIVTFLADSRAAQEAAHAVKAAHHRAIDRALVDLSVALSVADIHGADSVLDMLRDVLEGYK